jgi:hypothetical protein
LLFLLWTFLCGYLKYIYQILMETAHKQSRNSSIDGVDTGDVGVGKSNIE